MVRTPVKGERRTIEQLKEHWQIEKELAYRLRNASREERSHLYSYLYDELYRRVPLHPQLTRKKSSAETAKAVGRQMQFLGRYLNKDVTFLEVGPGDCALSIEATKFARQVYAVDISSEITSGLTRPPNFHLILSDGGSVPMPQNSVNVAYSHQLIEHLHPDDAVEQMEDIYDALTPGGVCICITLNRLNGPHDISKYFSDAATGFHLREYTVKELSELYRKVGFRRIRVHVGARGVYIVLPTFTIVMFETLLQRLPRSIGKAVAGSLLFRLLLGIRLTGVK